MTCYFFLLLNTAYLVNIFPILAEQPFIQSNPNQYMLRTSIEQNQFESSKGNKMSTIVLSEHNRSETSFIVKEMIKMIKIKSKNTMDDETRIHFSKITDSIVRMAEEIRQ